MKANYSATGAGLEVGREDYRASRQSRNDVIEILFIGILIVGGIIAAIWYFSKNTGNAILDGGKIVVSEAGKAAMTAAKTAIIDVPYQAGKDLRDQLFYAGTVARGGMEGYPAPNVPATPEGFNPSNWTWQLTEGVSLGLPAGMTPGEFCRLSPDSPICKEMANGSMRENIENSQATTNGQNPTPTPEDVWREYYGGMT